MPSRRRRRNRPDLAGAAAHPSMALAAACPPRPPARSLRGEDEAIRAIRPRPTDPGAAPLRHRRRRSAAVDDRGRSGGRPDACRRQAHMQTPTWPLFRYVKTTLVELRRPRPCARENGAQFRPRESGAELELPPTGATGRESSTPRRSTGSCGGGRPPAHAPAPGGQVMGAMKFIFQSARNLSPRFPTRACRPLRPADQLRLRRLETRPGSPVSVRVPSPAPGPSPERMLPAEPVPVSSPIYRSSTRPAGRPQRDVYARERGAAILSARMRAAPGGGRPGLCYRLPVPARGLNA